MASASTVLVIDDDPLISELVQLVLEEAGYRVLAAGDGEEGLQLAAQEKPGLILLDLLLPGLDGEEVLRELRVTPAIASTPVAVFSAQRGAARRLKHLGVVGELSKPFELEDLVSLVAKVLAS